LRALSDAEAKFLVVGGYAVSIHSQPRATGDLEVWVEPSAENAARVDLRGESTAPGFRPKES